MPFIGGPLKEGHTQRSSFQQSWKLTGAMTPHGNSKRGNQKVKRLFRASELWKAIVLLQRPVNISAKGFSTYYCMPAGSKLDPGLSKKNANSGDLVAVGLIKKHNVFDLLVSLPQRASLCPMD